MQIDAMVGLVVPDLPSLNRASTGAPDRVGIGSHHHLEATMKSTRIITTALAATALMAGSAQAMPFRDGGFTGNRPSEAAALKLHMRDAAKHSVRASRKTVPCARTIAAIDSRRGPLATSVAAAD
jgi:hypothetical protein